MPTTDANLFETGRCGMSMRWKALEYVTHNEPGEVYCGNPLPASAAGNLRESQMCDECREISRAYTARYAVNRSGNWLKGN